MRINSVADDILLVPFICILPVRWLKHLEDFLSVGVHIVHVDGGVRRYLLAWNIGNYWNLWHILTHLSWLRKSLLTILLRRDTWLRFIVERLLVIEVTHWLTRDWSVSNSHLICHWTSLEIILLRRNATLIQILPSISHSVLCSKLLNLRGTL